MSKPSSASPKSDGGKQRFLDVFPRIQGELLHALDQAGMPKDARDWFQQSLEYNAPGGKLNRGLSVVHTVEIIRGKPLDDTEYYKAAVLGWGVELLQAFFLVADDMMDQSITRRGQPCWFRHPNVNNIAINDSFMLEASIYHLLKLHFRGDPCYVHLLELFLETTFQTEIGQLLDLITAPEDVVDLSKFSLERHRLIVIYKTAYYSFYLPVALGMRMCHITDESHYERAKSILIPLGEYFQVQDDYLDGFAPPELLGKIGTDIIDNKCSWNINVALGLANAEQRKVLDEHYGRKSAESEAKVKQVFKEVDIPARYAEYEQGAYERLCALIDAIPEPAPGTEGLRREVFKSFLEKIYKRTK
ncbi:hypothetical protein BOTBODRAFT_181455 [Botryobasidium botryosum FD-172 SS1]|uniref:(2E,6E)-farnesyl diphosphate synthase n=1 Tax=Botryobasidium botryosum (strain FD-172 SS1) TaxID=930990 RepID=A0A067LWA9_BOTB1|nr:hypothetical protein BOTBODRAFT_181455 [Botryobasidium botryosum FD-172 SS1]